jgi:uncharacterized protein (TIGR00255 family)
MIRSMTAFARCQSETEWGELTWEVRSVNHRYLETNIRLPEEFRALETSIRDRIQKRLSRGKVDCGLRFRPAKSAAAKVQVNEEMARAVIEASSRVEDWMHNPGRMSALNILGWPGVIEEAEQDIKPIHEAALKALDAALDELIQSREAEGMRTQEMLQQRLDSITDIVGQVRERRPQLMDNLRTKLLQRIESLGVEADPQRLEQELVMIAQKLDVDEELDRLSSHLEEMNSIFSRDEPVGRRMDFLMQEFNREANTLGSKSHDSDTTRFAVELKVMIEQMREQVQNIE